MKWLAMRTKRILQLLVATATMLMLMPARGRQWGRRQIVVYVLAGISMIIATKSCKILFVRIASHFIAQAGSIALFDQSN